MIFIKRIISIILVCFVFLSCFAVPVSAEETTDTTDTTENLNNYFDDPVGTGPLGSYDGYYYMPSPFDSDNPNVYFKESARIYHQGFIDTDVYPYWIVLYAFDGANCFLLVSDEPFVATRSSIGALQYVVVESETKGNFMQFQFITTDYEQVWSDGGYTYIPGSSWRQFSDIKKFVYSNDEFDNVTNFRYSSDDIYYDYTSLDNGKIIFPKTPYSPVVKPGVYLDNMSMVDAYQDTIGFMLSGILDTLNAFGDLFNPLFEFAEEFWDEHVSGFFNEFINNFIMYFKELFYPDITFLTENFDGLYYSLSQHFPILNDISDMYSSVSFAFENADNTPNVSFTYEGETYNILNLELFDPVMPWVHSIILVFAYYRFLSGLYKRLPNMI